MILIPNHNVVPRGLVGHWGYAASGGSVAAEGTVKDGSGNGLHMALVGSCALSANGLLFGSGNYGIVIDSVEVPSVLQNIGNPNVCTLAALVKISNDAGVGGTIAWAPDNVLIELRQQSSNGSSMHCPFSWGVQYVDGGARIALGRTSQYTTAASVTYGNTAIDDGEWHHIGTTENGGTVVHYLDGVADGGTSAWSTNNTSVGTVVSNLFIGVRTRDSGAIDTANAWYDSADDLRLYNRTLSPGEMKLLANGMRRAA